MFTGIVEELGRVHAITPQYGGARLEIDAPFVLADAEIGSSIAVNGVCLTVVGIDRVAGRWSGDAVIETMRRTNLGDLAAGDAVNLERPVRLADRLGGHVVQGHVDGTGVIAARSPGADGSVAIEVHAPADVLRYVIEKGSIAVDGVSLTVAGLGDDTFSVAVIPHTQQATTLGTRAIGARVNLEVDMFAKYVERLLGAAREGGR
jgi:riboflavin synthase